MNLNLSFGFEKTYTKRMTLYKRSNHMDVFFNL